jgi:hypothetical protein
MLLSALACSALSVPIPLPPPRRSSLEILAHLRNRATESVSQGRLRLQYLSQNSYGIKAVTAEMARREEEETTYQEREREEESEGS